MNEHQSLQLVAKLLANENINVVRDTVETAAFDIINRTLILPFWKDLPPIVDELLVAHEVGHALYTDELYVDAAKKEPNLAGCMNILEDARIEKLIKNKYIGLRRVFNTAYNMLHERDFFKIGNVDVDQLNLADRINLHFKLGYRTPIKFTEAELYFVEKAERLETLPEVINLARELYGYLQENRQPELQTDPQPQFGDEDEENGTSMSGDREDMGQEEEDDQEDEDGSPSSGSGNEDIGEDTKEDDVQPVTNEAFAQSLKMTVDGNTEHVYHKFVPLEYDPVIGYKQIISRVEVSYDTPVTRDSEIVTAYRSFRQNTDNNVNYLVKEFEMKKAASSYKRTQITKSGSLDMNKVWRYKLSDDIFRKVATVPEGKNHGMVFLLDWSGSMMDHLDDTVDQLINLVTFCRRAGIRHSVVAFSNHASVLNMDVMRRANVEARRHGNTDINPNTSGFSLLELFSSEMSNTDFTSMSMLVRSRRLRREYGLGGTPLNEALLYLYNTYLDSFHKKYRVEKTTLITFSDGEGGVLDRQDDFKYKLDAEGRQRRVALKHCVTDERTRKVYNWPTYPAAAQTETLIQMIKDRHNCVIMGFYVLPNRRRDVMDAILSHYPDISRQQSWNRTEEVRNKLRQDGFVSLQGTNRDKMFLIAATTTKINYDEMNISEKASTRTIAKQFTKYLTTKKTSRVLLSKFIDSVA